MTDALIGVLLMAYGGPESLDDLPGYLADIRGGRPTPRAVLDEITNNYRQIGGRSPLLHWTRKQADGIEAQLNASGPVFRVYLGMRHWAPHIEETVRDMITDGITRAVAMVLAPQYSGMSIARYHAKIQASLQMYDGIIEFATIDGYHDVPGYIQALVNRVRAGIAHWSEPERDAVHVVFSAHSLPQRILAMGDPYQDQLFETARLVASGAELRDDQWSWSYQSAGRTMEPWLGPRLEDHLALLAARGVRDLVSVPIGFVCDHVEILYDIDIKAQEVARSLGLRLERPPALNDDPLFLAALADLIHARAFGWLPALSEAGVLTTDRAG